MTIAVTKKPEPGPRSLDVDSLRARTRVSFFVVLTLRPSNGRRLRTVFAKTCEGFVFNRLKQIAQTKWLEHIQTVRCRY
jgi:hypothetical protein